MFRDLFVSFTSHVVILGSLLYISTFGEKSVIQNMNMYRVRTVTPQSISELIKKTGAVNKQTPKIPQIKTKKEVLPQKHRKKSQTVKRSSQKSTTVKKSKSEDKGSNFRGIKTDSKVDMKYLVELQERIEQNWRVPNINETIKTTVYFKIAKDGKILRVFVEKTNGKHKF